MTESNLEKKKAKKQSFELTHPHQAGYDKDLFEKARLWTWNELEHSNRGADVLTQYSIMHNLLFENYLSQIDLPKLLRESAKEGVKLSQKRLSEYKITPARSWARDEHPRGEVIGWWGKQVRPGLEYRIYLDAPTGFILTYKGIPQAIVGLAATREGSLMIHQLQGVIGRYIDPDEGIFSSDRVLGIKSSRGLAPLDWQKLMVAVAAEFGRMTGIERVAIQTGSKNHWGNLYKNEAPHLTPGRAARAYDLPAMRLGFERGEDDNWYKDIQ